MRNTRPRSCPRPTPSARFNRSAATFTTLFESTWSTTTAVSEFDARAASVASSGSPHARTAARASNSLTAVVVDQVDSGKVVKVAAERLNLALGVGLGQLRGRVFRIGHLGSLNELEVLATLAGTELALTYSGQRVELGAGVAAAQRYFAECV